MPISFTRRSFCLVLAGSVLFTGQGVLGEDDFAVIPLRYRPVEQVVPAVRALLGTQGRAAADRAGNALIVHARAEDLDRVRRLVAAMDQATGVITVQVRLLEGSDSALSEAGRTFPLAVGPDRAVSGIRTRQFMVQVRSGERARLTVARDIPWGPAWEMICQRTGVAVARTQARQVVESGLWVEARLLSSGDILLNLAPRFTAQDGQEVEVISAAASLVLVPGTWSVLAASTKPSVQQSWALVLGQGAASGGRSQNLREWALLVRAVRGRYDRSGERPEIRSLHPFPDSRQ